MQSGSCSPSAPGADANRSGSRNLLPVVDGGGQWVQLEETCGDHYWIGVTDNFELLHVKERELSAEEFYVSVALAVLRW